MVQFRQLDRSKLQPSRSVDSTHPSLPPKSQLLATLFSPRYDFKLPIRELKVVTSFTTMGKRQREKQKYQIYSNSIPLGSPPTFNPADIP